MRRLPPLLALLLSACLPMLEGPQLRKLPPGLGYVVNQRAGGGGGELFGHAVAESRFWMSPGEPVSTLSIVGYRGRFTGADVDALREQEKADGAVSRVRTDGRESWTWFHPDDWRPTCTAVVPYDDVTFVIVLASGRVEHRDEKLMRAAVASFARAPGASVRWIAPLVFVLVIALAVAARLKRRSEPEPVRAPVVSRPAPPPPSPLKPPPRA